MADNQMKAELELFTPVPILLGAINPRSDVRKWRALPWGDAPVFDLGSRPDEPPISPSTLGRQRAPSGLGQIGGSSSLCPGRILTHASGCAAYEPTRRSDHYAISSVANATIVAPIPATAN